MSEIGVTNGFNVPADQNFNTETFQGSMQQVLSDNIGSYVIVEFLIGTGQLNTRQGILYYVGSQFLVLLDEIEARYIVCDIFAVKFVTFLLPGYRPGNVTNEDSTSAGDADVAAAPASAMLHNGIRTPGQAAYAHIARQNSRR